MDTRFKSTVIRHPALAYTTAASVLAIGALSPTPNFIPLVALLACMRLTSWTFLHRPGRGTYLSLQALCVAVASAARHLAPSLEALSTPSVSLAVIGAITFMVSFYASVVVALGCYGVRYTPTHWSKLTLFPALWASAWGFMSSVSPVGQLVTWSPVLGLGPYAWLRPFVGQWGIDWVAAAWSVILSEVVGDWIVGPFDEEGDESPEVQPLLVDHHDDVYGAADHAESAKPRQDRSWSSKSKALLALFTFLSLLTIPAYFAPFLPLPVNSHSVTPITVACALPKVPYAERDKRSLTVDDYLRETMHLQSLVQTAVILWPEGALSFASTIERDATFTTIQSKLNSKKYLGVTFEDVVPSEGSQGKLVKRNGFAFLAHSGSPMIEYYKRNLVPIAESFSMTPGKEAPRIARFDMTAPKGYGPGWGPAPNHTRPITLSASICLDFASSSSFTPFEERPALILAPARTWQVGVGYAMWEQAKARAAEFGSTVLWCDGGDGGLSGIAHGDYSEIVQRGGGSWLKTIPLEYPFNQHRTFYGAGGQSTAFLVVWFVCGAGGGATPLLGIIARRRGVAGHAVQTVFGRIRAALRRTERPALPSTN